MKRLSSDKAQKILEFLIRKRLKVANAKLMFVQCSRNLYHVEVDILHNDGKGKTSLLIVRYHPVNVGYNDFLVLQTSLSFSKLFRWIEKRAKREAVFEIDGIAVFTKSDSLETALIDMDLEDTHGN